MYTFARLAFIVVEISPFENQLVQKLKKLLCNAKGGKLITHGHTNHTNTIRNKIIMEE